MIAAAHPSPETIDAVIEAIGLVLGPLGRKAQAESSLDGDLCFDCLHRVCLAQELDEAFAIAIPDDDLAEWETVTDVAATVTRELARIGERVR